MFFVDRFDQELMEILAVKEKVSIFKSTTFFYFLISASRKIHICMLE